MLQQAALLPFFIVMTIHLTRGHLPNLSFAT